MNFFEKKLSENLERNVFWCTFASVLKTASRGGAVVARWAHNPKAGGSIPSPATLRRTKVLLFLLSFFENVSFLKNKRFKFFVHVFNLYLRISIEPRVNNYPLSSINIRKGTFSKIIV